MHYSLTRATAWNLAGYLYLTLASLISVPILVQSLGVTLFSQYGLIIATLGVVSSLNLGLPQAVVRALSRHHADQKELKSIWATSSLLFVITGFVAAIIATFISYYLQIETLVLPLVFCLTLISSIVSHYLTLPHATGHFGYYNAKTFIVGTANTLLCAYLAWRGQGLSIILATQLMAYFLTLLALAHFSLKFFPKPWRNQPDRVIAKLLISFGVKNQVGTLVGQIQAQYAKFLLVAISPLSLSAYMIALGLVQKAAGGVSQLSSAIYPASARGELQTSFQNLYHRLQGGLALLAILGVVIYYTYGQPLLTWWLVSPDLVALVHSILRILVIYLAILILTPLPSAILDGRGRPEITSFFASLTTAIEIVLALVLLPVYGLLAPAYAGVIAVAMTTPALLYQTSRVLKSKV